MTPHPQADILRAIADGEELEQAYDQEPKWRAVDSTTVLDWITNDPLKDYTPYFRIKPKVININGIEVPKPMRETPKDDVSFWLADPTNQTGVCEFKWHPCSTHKGWLEAGLCHPTKEAATIHANALRSFSRRI